MCVLILYFICIILATKQASCKIKLPYSFRHLAINACLAPLYSVEGMHVITVEGIGDRQRGLHPVQVMRCSFITCRYSCGICSHMSIING